MSHRFGQNARLDNPRDNHNGPSGPNEDPVYPVARRFWLCRYVLTCRRTISLTFQGNRAATFPLQMLGYDVDVVNTVQFSNHTGYGHTNGTKTSPEQLEAIFEGLFTNGLVSHARLLTGYIPGAEALRVIGKQVERMRQNEGLVYLLDRECGGHASFQHGTCLTSHQL